MIDEPILKKTRIPHSDYKLLDHIDVLRIEAAQSQDKRRKEELGQFFTPAPIARLMASMFHCHIPVVRLLDAGAGVGSLFAAVVVILCNREDPPKEIHVTACEIDAFLLPYLQETMYDCEMFCRQHGVRFVGKIEQKDFILGSVEQLNKTLFSVETHKRPEFDCIILNPPYKKIQTLSTERKLLRQLGIETSNLYTGFLSIAMRFLAPTGEMVAITPRSFCNGPYFKPFRKDLLSTMALRHLHVFDSRNRAFATDDVLQENVVFYADKKIQEKSKIQITSSMDMQDEFILSNEVDYEQVVHPNDPQSFIHIMQDHLSHQVVEQLAQFHHSPDDLGLSISTGRVVDFRAAQYLRPVAEPGTVPLLFPTHVHYGSITWPKVDSKKPNALVHGEQTQSLLVPNDYYVLVKRFSSKEEKRRIVAAVYEPEHFSTTYVGFENHLNYFHRNGRGLPPLVARGLAAFLNSTLVDEYFRQFNGHTQVNATDLRNIKYPALSQLEALGARFTTTLSQDDIDALIHKELMAMPDIDDSSETNDLLRVKQKIEVTEQILKLLGFPRAQQNERSALTLLALLNLKPDMLWSQAEAPLCGITPMMEFFKRYYGKDYKPNTRETVRRQTVHQFLDAGLIVANPDSPERPINSPHAVYQIEQGALDLLRTFDTPEWETNLSTYLASMKTLQERYAQEREMRRIPVTVAPGRDILLSPGGQNILIEKIIQDFAPRYTPGGKVLYIGDTDTKFAYFDEAGLAALGVKIEAHGKMPDLIIHYLEKNWLILIEAVTSHGPIDGKRKAELQTLFRESSAGLVFVTTFLSRSAMVKYMRDISWETEVWVAEAPSHLIHFNGDRFLGPHEQTE